MTDPQSDQGYWAEVKPQRAVAALIPAQAGSQTDTGGPAQKHVY